MLWVCFFLHDDNYYNYSCQQLSNLIIVLQHFPPQSIFSEPTNLPKTILSTEYTGNSVQESLELDLPFPCKGTTRLKKRNRNLVMLQEKC